MHAGSSQFVLQHLRRATRGESTDGELLDAFLLRRDEDAAAALIRRHGPMVWGVCRRLSGHVHDAEDAFQAVFLILVRRASSVMPRERVGAWLHGVAVRTARKARVLADRRRSREKQVADVLQQPVESPVPDRDLSRVIDEELGRLPERLRLPVLLCDLEGRPRRDVARQLGLPVGTLGHRLDSARALLAARLSRRGIALGLGALAVAAVPRTLAAATARSAAGFAAGRSLASLVPAPVAALIEGAVLMSSTKFRLAAALALFAAVGGFGLHALQRPAAHAAENEPPKAAPARPPAEPPIDDRTFLRRLSLDLRGIPPTNLETNYFVEDKDKAKRRKVAGWMLGSPNAENKTGTDEATYERRIRLFRQLMESSDDRVLGEWFKTKPDDPEVKKLQERLDYYRKAEGLQREKKYIEEYFKQLPSNDKPSEEVESKREQEHLKKAYGFLSQWQSDKPNRPFFEDTWRSDRASDTAETLAGLLALGAAVPGNDAEFLRRVMLDLTGQVPTSLEQRYFAADNDPKKREKVVAWLLKDPAAARQIELWKKATAVRAKTTKPASLGERFDRLLPELLTGSRSDVQILEAMTLATMARFPTDAERQFLSAHLKGRSDRRTAWADLLAALLNTAEHRAHVESLRKK